MELRKVMLNNYKRGKIANAIALHDFANPKPIDVKNWCEYIVKFFEDNGFVPSRMDITGENGVKGRKNITFKAGRKKLYD
jgi:hypothetical protein